MPNELSEKVYSDGTVVKLRDDTARAQIAGITDKVGFEEITVSSPGSGTSLQKATAIINEAVINRTFNKPFSLVNIKYDGTYRGELIVSAINNKYSFGIYMSYYTDYVYRFININGTITVKQLAEV